MPKRFSDSARCKKGWRPQTIRFSFVHRASCTIIALQVFKFRVSIVQLLIASRSVDDLMILNIHNEKKNYEYETLFSACAYVEIGYGMSDRIRNKMRIAREHYFSIKLHSPPSPVAETPLRYRRTTLVTSIRFIRTARSRNGPEVNDFGVSVRTVAQRAVNAGGSIEPRGFHTGGAGTSYRFRVPGRRVTQE